jgi:hypothetical protein
VVIDEAQNLEPSVLETVRLLSDFETPQAKLLQIVLSGQPELADKLARPSLRQLRQRISVLCTIAPLQAEEVDGYIKRRLEAGGRREPLFSPGAVRAIAELSEGIPRNINNICFNALSLGCASRVPTIDASIVQQVKADFDLDALCSDPGAESSETISLPDAGVESSDFGFAGWSVDHPQVRTHDALTPNRALAYLQEIVQQLQKKEKKKKSLAN